MDIEYSPTGREFVTGSYDRTVSFFIGIVNHQSWCMFTNLFVVLPRCNMWRADCMTFAVLSAPFVGNMQVRIFTYNEGHSREVYHTKRMQRYAYMALFKYCGSD